MGIKAEAWFLYAHDGKGSRRGSFVRESYEIPDLQPGEILAAPIYGSWEANMDHALQRNPVDVCRRRGEERVVLGNCGVLRVLDVGPNVTLVEPDQLVVMSASSVIDQFGFPKLIPAFDSPNTIGCLSTKMKCREHEVTPIPDDTKHPLKRWGAFSTKHFTAWSNWKVAYGTFRLMVDEHQLPRPHVWAWGGGTALAQLDLARRRDNCEVVMLSGDARRRKIIELAGVTAIDRRTYGQLNFDERRMSTDPDYRDAYRAAEAAFVEDVMKRTNDLGVQVFVDNIGTPVYRATMRALGREGVITTAGWKQGMTVNYLRAATCISRHQLIHTHGASYPEQLEAVAFAERDGWLPYPDERIFSFDEIPQLADAYSAGELGISTLYAVNPE